MRRHFPFLMLLATYLVVGSLYALFTPPWQAPDEPAHYNYVRQLAAGRLPLIEPGDYDEQYQRMVIDARFDPQYSIAPFEYEDWQPPLYYLLLTPVYWLSGGSLIALRLATLLIGCGVVTLAYAIARRLWPERRWQGLTAVAFIAFLPQHLAILAAVNNDALAELLIAAILYGLVELVQADGRSEPAEAVRTLRPLGVWLGLGFLTKGTVYLMAPLVVLAVWWRFRADRATLWRALLVTLAPALLLGSLWWGRNLVVYDGLDPMGIAAHDAVVTGQPRTAEWVATYGAGETAVRFLRTSFNSFWGQFGWMGVPMPGWVYRILYLFTGLTILGLALAVVSRGERRTAVVRRLLAGLFLLSLGLYLSYNLTYVQHQGRYLFPALIPISLAVAVGWAMLLRPFYRRWPILAPLLPLGLSAALIGLALLALFRFIIPALAG